MTLTDRPVENKNWFDLIAFAVITGATEGIGKAYANVVSKNAFDMFFSLN